MTKDLLEARMKIAISVLCVNIEAMCEDMGIPVSKPAHVHDQQAMRLLQIEALACAIPNIRNVAKRRSDPEVEDALKRNEREAAKAKAKADARAAKEQKERDKEASALAIETAKREVLLGHDSAGTIAPTGRALEAAANARLSSQAEAKARADAQIEEPDIEDADLLELPSEEEEEKQETRVLPPKTGK